MVAPRKIHFKQNRQRLRETKPTSQEDNELQKRTKLEHSPNGRPAVFAFLQHKVPYRHPLIDSTPCHLRRQRGKTFPPALPDSLANVGVGSRFGKVHRQKMLSLHKI